MAIYIDASIFLYAVLYDDDRGQRCRKVMHEIVEGRLDAVTSTLTWDEFSDVVQRVLGREVAVVQGERFLRFPRLDFAPCIPEVLIEAQRLRAETPIGARDCIHAATARVTGSETIRSEDPDFDGIPGLSRRPA